MQEALLKLQISSYGLDTESLILVTAVKMPREDNEIMAKVYLKLLESVGRTSFAFRYDGEDIDADGHTIDRTLFPADVDWTYFSMTVPGAPVDYHLTDLKRKPNIGTILVLKTLFDLQEISI